MSQNSQQPISPTSLRNESDLRHANHAESVGYGIHRQRITPGPVPKREEEPDVYSLDGKIEWSDTPTFPDQITRGPKYWKLDRMEAKVFDLSKPEDMEAYSKLLTDTALPGTNKAIVTSDRKYDDVIHSWRVLVEIQYIKYRKLFKTEKST